MKQDKKNFSKNLTLSALMIFIRSSRSISKRKEKKKKKTCTDFEMQEVDTDEERSKDTPGRNLLRT